MCCLPAFGSKCQLVQVTRLFTWECKHAATSSSLESKLSISDFVSHCLKIFSKVVRQNVESLATMYLLTSENSNTH